jgi:2-oxoglutarate ferredoxin oxidoreductase subunit alpha
MVRLRHERIARISVPPALADDPDGDSELLVVGWGSTSGPIGEACRKLRAAGVSVAHLQLRHLNPFPANLGEVLRSYPTVVAPEMNLGQLATMLRARYLVDVRSVTKVRGEVFTSEELYDAFRSALNGTLSQQEAEKVSMALDRVVPRHRVLEEQLS